MDNCWIGIAAASSIQQMKDLMMAKLNNTRVRVPAYFAVAEANSQGESHDAATLNPSGRITTEGENNSERRFLKCKSDQHINNECQNFEKLTQATRAMCTCQEMQD